MWSEQKLQKHPQSLSKVFDMGTDLHCTSKWRGLINNGAALYEKKRICEAERKQRERKANTDGPPAEPMTLTCFIYSTLEDCKSKLRCRLVCKMSSSMQMIWIRMPAQRQKCKEPWIKSHSHVITMMSQSAQKQAVHQPAPGKPFNEPTITVNGQKLKVVDRFTYLGSTLSRAVHINDEVTARIAKANVTFGSALNVVRTKATKTPSKPL